MLMAPSMAWARDKDCQKIRDPDHINPLFRATRFSARHMMLVAR
jgi:hypothetical protein